MVDPKSQPRIGVFLDLMTLNHAARQFINDSSVRVSLDLVTLREHLGLRGRLAFRNCYVSAPRDGSPTSLQLLTQGVASAGFTPCLLPQREGRPWVEPILLPDVFEAAEGLDMVVLGVTGAQYGHAIEKLGAQLYVAVLGPRPCISRDLVDS